MGCSISCKLLSSSSTSSSFKNIRVVHLNGYVEEFDHPVTVSEITGKPAKHFVFTHAQLLSAAGAEHLKPDAVLEPGHVYFLLPYSTFQSDVSPADLAPVAKKLCAVAKNYRSSCKAKSRRKNPTNHHRPSSRTCRVNRFSDRYVKAETQAYATGDIHVQRSQKSPSWKPILSTIRELSFNRRSESDLQEKDLEKENSSVRECSASIRNFG